MNYSAVAPPSQSGSVDPQSAFADALARAKQIAAKINQPGEETGGAALKRPYEGGSDSQPEAKKMAAMNDPLGHQMRGMTDPGASQASQAAAAAAAQINAKLGINSGSPNMGAPMQPPVGMSGGMGLVSTEDYSVPDRMVGLIIGKGGEQITAIQAESGCKVQFAPDSGGMPERPCTLTGPESAIRKAREMIDAIIAKGQGMPDPQSADGVTMVEVLIPGNKVGLVIGKGGETIKGLQENAGVKMVMIQDSNQPSHYDKPLRITGEMSRCQKAKDAVLDLIADKDGYGGGGGGGGDYGGRGGQEIPVPVNLVGVIIGKGGEMIKKIQAETGARVQFKPDDGSTPDRICSVTGPADRVGQAAQMIHELIQSALQRQNQGGPGGRGRGRGRGDDRNGGYGDRGPGGGRFGQFGGGDETTFSVPSEKCGLVIGKGGETIREINRQSNAHVELSRQPATNPRERLFKIQGSPDEIQTAIRLICEKAGLPPPGPDGHGNGGPPGGPAPGPPGGYGDQYGQYGQQYGQQSQPPYQQPQPGPGPTPPNYGGAPQQQGWGSNYPQWNQPQQTPNDPNKQANDATAAAWAAYYQQYYQGAQNPQQAPQQQPQQQQPQQQQPAPQPHQQPAQQAQGTVNPATGQTDYSAAWAEYYRQQGMPYHAQAILQQAATGQPQQPPQPPQ